VLLSCFRHVYAVVAAPTCPRTLSRVAAGSARSAPLGGLPGVRTSVSIKARDNAFAALSTHLHKSRP
jgi:hypothetical protein